MTIRFQKMNGAGNDFVLVDNLAGEVRLTSTEIAHICNRRLGVGADGLIMIEAAAESGEFHMFHMRFYNADGGPAEMCGNGARCAAAFAVGLGLGRLEDGRVKVRFMTDSGPISATVTGTSVSMAMMDARGMRRDVAVGVAQVPGTVHFIIVGTRHAVVEVEDARALADSEVVGIGRQLRHDPAFAPEGANVNFASIDAGGRIHLRTYEKGVEDETLACGTGSVAAAVLYAHGGRGDSPRTVVQHGGDELIVSFALKPDGAGDVVMEGPVEVNFEGSITL